MSNRYSYVTDNPGDYEDLVPMLTEALTNLEHRDFAAYALAEIGSPAKQRSIPNLVQALLFDPENYVSQPFLEALASIGCHTPQVEEALVSILDDLSYAEIFVVAETFLGFGIYRKEVVQALCDASEGLQDHESQVELDALLNKLRRLDGADGDNR